MFCPFCGADDTKVIDSRLVADGGQVRRRRECVTCRERFTTYEAAELVMPRVIKQNGSREPFDEDKLRSGLQRALEKRPVAVEAVESELAQIKNRLRATGERELDSRVLRELVMRGAYLGLPFCVLNCVSYDKAKFMFSCKSGCDISIPSSITPTVTPAPVY